MTERQNDNKQTGEAGTQTMVNNSYTTIFLIFNLFIFEDYYTASWKGHDREEPPASPHS